MERLDRRRLGNILTILGVLAWLPFILLVALGYEPSIFPFLAVHLTGVIGGSRLRSSANPESKKKHSRRTVIGRILIILGVLAWAPYIYQNNILGRSIEMTPYLAAHLTGVLSGIAILVSVPLQRSWQRSQQN